MKYQYFAASLISAIRNKEEEDSPGRGKGGGK
jgi:hypothetical protein